MSNFSWATVSPLDVAGDEGSLAEPMPSKASKQVFLFSLVTWSVTVLVGVVGNAVLCVTICTSPSLRTAMNTYVFGIGLVDLLTCLLLLPLRMAVEIMARDGQDVPDELYSIELLVRTSTDLARLLLIQTLSFERYQAIARPFSVSKATARRRAVIVSSCVAGFVVLLGGLSIRFFCDSVNFSYCATTNSWGDLELYIELPLTLTAILSISLSYSLILLVLHQQRRKMAEHNKQPKPKPKPNQVAPLQPKDKEGRGCRKNQAVAALETRHCSCRCLSPVIPSCCVKRSAVGSTKQVVQKALFEGEGGNLSRSSANLIADEGKPGVHLTGSKYDKYEHSNTTESDLVIEYDKEAQPVSTQNMDLSSSKHKHSTKSDHKQEIQHPEDSLERQVSCVTSSSNREVLSVSQRFSEDIGCSSAKSGPNSIQQHDKASNVSANGLEIKVNEQSSEHNTRIDDNGNRTPSAISISASVPRKQDDGNNISEEQLDCVKQCLSGYSHTEMVTVDPTSHDIHSKNTFVSTSPINTIDTTSICGEGDHTTSGDIRLDTFISNSPLPLLHPSGPLGPNISIITVKELGENHALKSIDSKSSLAAKTTEPTDDASDDDSERNTSNLSLERKAIDTRTQDGGEESIAGSAEPKPKTLNVARAEPAISSLASTLEENSTQHVSVTQETKMINYGKGKETLDATIGPVNQVEETILSSAEVPGPVSADKEKHIEVVDGDGTVHLEPVRKVTQGSNSAGTPNIEGAVCLMNPKNKELGRRKVELKAALKVGLLFLSFLLLWTPLPVMVTVIRVISTVPRKSVQADLLGVFSALASSTAALDPILYGVLNRSIRTAMKQFLKKMKRRVSQSLCAHKV